MAQQEHTMTVITRQAQRLLTPRMPHRSFFETFIRTLITVCVALTVVLTSLSIYDGSWLLADGHLFRLWQFCTTSNHTGPYCLRDLSQAHVPRLVVGMVLACSLGSLTRVTAIFGLELLMVSQLHEDNHSQCKWAVGPSSSSLSFFLSFGGLLCFVILLRKQVTLIGLTLMFWCEFKPSFLFFLKAISGLHINSITYPWVHSMKLRSLSKDIRFHKKLSGWDYSNM